MKKSFCVFLIIALTLIGVSITFSWRGFDNGRWTNRDDQIEDPGNMIGVDGFGAAWIRRVGRDSDKNPDDGPLKTESIGRTYQSLVYHHWYASCTLSNDDPALTKGNWHGYADVPNKDPDTDYKYKVDGEVDKDFSRGDIDWFADHDPGDTIDDCSAWASIDMFDAANNISYDSYSHVPF